MLNVPGRVITRYDLIEILSCLINKSGMSKEEKVAAVLSEGVNNWLSSSSDAWEEVNDNLIVGVSFQDVLNMNITWKEVLNHQDDDQDKQ